jgi:tetratricopeptide (TPR) repeat protein
MHKNTVIFVIVAAVAGFIGGFLLANSLNRSEMATLRAQNGRTETANSNTSQGQPETELTSDEISSKIAEADKNPGNFAFQKDLGIALYRYATMKQDEDLLNESARILDRANALNNRDFDVLVALGNAHFDIGYAKKDNARFQTARDIYSKALEIKPGDPDVSTDRGLTYFFQNPPAYDQAAAELEKISEANPKHQRSLQFLVQAYVKQNKFADAEKALAKLKSINPSNPSIAELTSQITAAQSGTAR